MDDKELHHHPVAVFFAMFYTYLVLGLLLIGSLV